MKFHFSMKYYVQVNVIFLRLFIQLNRTNLMLKNDSVQNVLNKTKKRELDFVPQKDL